MIYPSFIGGTYESQAVTADQELTMNWYVEPMEVEGPTTERALYPTPGVVGIATGAGSRGRAHITAKGREFAVIGSIFYEIDSAGNLTNRGTVSDDGRSATISYNGDGGNQLFIAAGGNGYLFNLSTNTFSTIAALAGIADMGAHLDGYFLALDQATSTVYVSDLLDGTSWPATQYFQRSARPDPWESMIVAGSYIYLFGSETSEIWQDVGTSPVPFALHPSGILEFGTCAEFSPRVADTAVMWLGQTKEGRGMVIRAYGFDPEIVSTFPLQRAINGYSVVSDAIGDAYNDLGHTFYLLTFPNEGVTWAWDFQSQVWANRGTWIEEETRFDVWRPIWHTLAFGQHRWLDISTGAVYEASTSYGSDVDDREIRRVRRAPCLMHENLRVFYPGFEVDLEPGLGLSSGQGSNPLVMLRLSNDGGKTWSNEISRSAGAMGNYSTRVRWNRCGSARRRVWEVSVTDPIPWRLTRAYLTPDPQVSTG